MQTIRKQLADAEVHGPGSKELERNEKNLIRYFEREYQRYLKNPQTPEQIGVFSDRGPIMEETDELMEAHYDERPEFFAGFLDNRYRAYTMAYYGETGEAARNSAATLEEAQQAKFSLIAQRAQIQGNERIFNIGCGFGSLESFLLQEYPGVEVVGITPSQVQIDYLKQKMQDPSHPLSSRFTLIEGAVDKLPMETLGKHRYDLVISVGVFEQLLNMRAMLELIAQLLIPGGRTFHHFITSQVTIPQLLDPKKTRIGQYFPGGRVWPRDEFARHTEHFDVVNTWFVNGFNYWRTLDEWHRRYWNNIPDLYGEVFDIEAIKYWNEYFSLCKAMFAPLNGEFYGNSHYLFQLKS
jgi:cyclopropane-fatty-acyl-phospholipid synthase